MGIESVTDWPGPRAWVSNADAFMDRIGACPKTVVVGLPFLPPAGEARIDRFLTGQRLPMPRMLRRLYAEGSEGNGRRYSMEVDIPEGSGPFDFTTIHGGVELLPLSAIPGVLRSLQLRAAQTWNSEDSTERRVWEKAFPFISVENGDYVAVDTGALTPGAVAYLCHDGESKIVGRTLMAFLRSWEEVCFLGPEIWMLEPFFSEEGFLEPQNRQSANVREAIGLGD